MPDQHHSASARGRVLDLFAIHNRGTAVVIDIVSGIWSSGAQLVCAKGRYRIRSVEATDGQDVPPTAIALLIDDDNVKQSVSVGEEVWATP